MLIKRIFFTLGTILGERPALHTGTGKCRAPIEAQGITRCAIAIHICVQQVERRRRPLHNQCCMFLHVYRNSPDTIITVGDEGGDKTKLRSKGEDSVWIHTKTSATHRGDWSVFKPREDDDGIRGVERYPVWILHELNSVRGCVTWSSYEVNCQ